MIAPLVTACLLAIAVVMSWVRIARWQMRARWWRLALLLMGQPMAAALLYLTLFPPPHATIGVGTLTIVTRNAGAAPMGAISLPEAGWRHSEQAPDLATALRRYPGIMRLRVLGEGLEARDVDAARGVAIAFDPPPLPRGLIALATPSAPVAPGAAFSVGGETSGLSGGSVALIDPAGREVSRSPVGPDGGFVLSGAARVPGVALFHVRLRDDRDRTVEEADVPIWVAPILPISVLSLAGAPGPEVKYWRRWASDARLTVTTRVALGAGLTLGDPAPPLTTAALARYDFIMTDERSWTALNATERSAVIAAARGGAGLLLRATGPLSANARPEWAALGMPLLPGTTMAAATLSADADGDPPPLTRRVMIVPSPAVTVLTRDRAGAALTAWTAVGLGRVGLWTLADAAGLVTAGHGARFGELWAQTVSTLARPRSADGITVSPLPQAGVRMQVCGFAPSARMVDDRGTTAILPDPTAGGCGGYWPRRPGWHVLRQNGADRPIYVYPAEAMPGVRAVTRRDATIDAQRGTGRNGAPPAATPMPRPGSAWPWFAALLATLGSLWWFERRPFGRKTPVPS